ncbi:MAG: flippase [Candidatus Daviesbacteria bacterium]|nr:flippase [Candidatus Daviesbacteria bacterium]
MRNILKQTSWLFLAQSLTRIVGFFYTIYLARSFGVADFGLLTVALAYFSIISSVADLGFNRFLIREVALDRSKVSELLWNISILRVTLTSVLFAVFSVILYLFDADKMRVSLILLATLAILPQAIALTFDAVFVAIQKLQFSAASLFISSLATALFGFILINNGFGTFGAVNALIFGQVIYALALLVFLYKYKQLILSAVRLSIIKKIIIGSLPYGLLGILGLLYFRVDAVLLSYMRGNFETGIYGAAYRFLEAIIFIPGAFAMALFPALARLHGENTDEMKKLYFKSLKLMGAAGMILFFAYLLILPEVIKIFLPNYLQAIEAVRILSLSIPFIFLATPGVQVLFSSEKYLKNVIVLSLFTVAFNIILNILFIPKFGFIAASWITVVSDALSFIIFYNLITKKIFR